MSKYDKEAQGDLLQREWDDHVIEQFNESKLFRTVFAVAACGLFLALILYPIIAEALYFYGWAK